MSSPTYYWRAERGNDYPLLLGNWKLNFGLYLTLWKYFVLAGWIMELIKVEEQFFAGLGFSISGDAWVMGNDNSDRRLLH